MFLFFIFFILFPVTHVLGVGGHGEENAKTLVIKSIELADPDKDLGYAAKIRFLPKGGGYKGTPVASERVRFCDDRGKLYVESTLLIDVPVYRRLQEWSWGPWCPQKIGFSCVSFMPKEGEEITIMDDDGFLLRGILGYFFSQKKGRLSGGHEPSFCQNLPIQERIAPLITYLDGYCYKKSPQLFKHRDDFEETNLMFFREAFTEGDYPRTVRIRPANHAYEMSYSVLHTLLTGPDWHKILSWSSYASLIFVQDESVFVRCKGGEICKREIKAALPNPSADHPLKNHAFNITPILDQEKEGMSRSKVCFQWVQGHSSAALGGRFREVRVSHTRDRTPLMKSSYALYTFSFFTHGHTPFFTYGPLYWKSYENRVGKTFFMDVMNRVQKALQDKACALFDYLEEKQSAGGGAHYVEKTLQDKTWAFDGIEAEHMVDGRAHYAQKALQGCAFDGIEAERMVDDMDAS